MQVGGRIERSTLNYNAKHLFIIPKSSPIAELLVRHSHVTNLHTGVDVTFTNLRQEYWILGALNIVRKTVFQCKRCFFQRKEFSTFLIQIEALLNSRPLCSSGDSTLDPPTPAHFCTGAPYTALSEPSLLDVPINRLKRWTQLQAMVPGLWKHWHMEYLTSLHERTKWKLEDDNLKVDTLVVLKEPNLLQSKWILGRIQEVHARQDDKVRVVIAANYQICDLASLLNSRSAGAVCWGTRHPIHVFL